MATVRQLVEGVKHHGFNEERVIAELLITEILLRKIAICTRADPTRKFPDHWPSKGKRVTINVTRELMDAVDAHLEKVAAP